MRSTLYGLLTREGENIIPLIGVNVSAVIIGRGARVKVIQDFKNIDSSPIEAIYKFPLPDGSTICSFKANIEGKVVTGFIEERDKAFETYDDALIEGNGAYLLDQERPNIFTISLGNLNPGSSATIDFEYITLLETNDKEVRFFLPTTISPRYIPDNISDGDGIPVGEKINPELSLDVPYRLSIEVDIKNAGNIEFVESPSHSVNISVESSNFVVKFLSETEKMDRDFVLNIHYKEKFKSYGYLHKYKDSDFIQIDCSFPEKYLSASVDKNAKQSDKEIIFVLDCSGSMIGSSIIQAKQAIEIFLKGLESGMYFNIYRFSNSFDKLFSSSMPYTKKNIEEALKYISKTEANFGGTEILAPLRDIYNYRNENNRDIILITDGEVGNEYEVIGLAKERQGKNRIFMVGIGYGPNEYLIRQVAKFSGGTSEIITPGDRIEPKIIGLFDKVKGASLCDIKILSNGDIEQAPVLVTQFQNDTISIFCKFKGKSDEMKVVKLKGFLNNSPVEWSIPVNATVENGEFIPKLWAREMINVLEHMPAQRSGSKQHGRKENLIKEQIIQISKEHGVISKETSFVAIESRTEAEKTKGESILKKVPVMLTKDWGGIKKIKNMNFCVYSGRNPFATRATRATRATSATEAWNDLKSFRSNIHIAIKMLHSQQPNGGFMIDKEISERIGTTLPEIKKISKNIISGIKTDKFLLLSTAIVLIYLEKKCNDTKYMWGSIVEKTAKWLEKQIEEGKPTINGSELMKWVEKYLEDLQPKQNIC